MRRVVVKNSRYLFKTEMESKKFNSVTLIWKLKEITLKIGNHLELDTTVITQVLKQKHVIGLVKNGKDLVTGLQ
jgi:predicted nucleotidyltransferase